MSFLPDDPHRRVLDFELKMVETMRLPFTWRPANAKHANYRLQLIQFLLAELAGLAEKTDPACEGTEKGKDERAISALRLAGTLVEQVAGWALDHVCGTAVRSEGLQDVLDADAHTFEAHGGSFRIKDYLDLPDEEARRLLRDLLFANSGGFPKWLCTSAGTALDGLAFGETYPLLAAVKEGRKVTHSEAVLQLKALEFVEYRAAFGLKKKKAIEVVSGAYAVADKTLMSWKDRLPTALGWRPVMERLAMARGAADFIIEIQKKGHGDKPFFDKADDNEIINQAVEDIEEEYGPASLLKYAALYRQRGS